MNLHRRILPLFALAATLISFAVSATAAKDGSQTESPEKPFKMLVLGDSVVWGQGLDDKDKFSYLISEKVKELLRRDVEIQDFSHSGATIVPIYKESLKEHGEVPIPSPTIREQYISAISKYDCVEKEVTTSGNAGRGIVCEDVNLILMNGCINDVALQKILNPFITKKEIKKRSKRYCSEEMTKLLNELSATFVNAKIIVTGYFPIIGRGAGSTPPGTARELFEAFVMKRKRMKVPREFRIDPSSWIVSRMAELSQAWASASNCYLSDSVMEANRRVEKRQIHFVTVDFAPTEAYGAKDTKLWRIQGFDSNRQPLTDDPKLDERRYTYCCKARADLDDVKMEPSFRLMLKYFCQPAGAGHPNAEGALKYRDAIWNVLRPLLTNN